MRVVKTLFEPCVMNEIMMDLRLDRGTFEGG